MTTSKGRQRIKEVGTIGVSREAGLADKRVVSYQKPHIDLKLTIQLRVAIN